ncbi:hypothetical protein Acr_16g0001120 [Actinidia rufa]|uniref:Uncharacterized protein n=1 Tax=Actinidia rufa TaxID=165716 RepID=A0A7J0FZY0_9ERIC|nr:hypothetical protein Acr_16g0001120 [Actinidia rufa]
MARSKVSQPTNVILEGTNYILWAQAMSSFLKGRKFWRYVTGMIPAPTQDRDEAEDKFQYCLEDWDNKNHQIITKPSLSFSLKKPDWALFALLTLRSFLLFLLYEVLHTSPFRLVLLLHLGLTGPSHYQFACPKNPNPTSTRVLAKPHSQEHRFASRSATGITEESPTSSSAGISISDIEALLRQLTSSSGNPPPTVLSSTTGTPSWYFDSGCCNHMTSDSSLFSSRYPTTHVPRISTTDYTYMHVNHVGSVSTSNLSLLHTYCIRSLAINLISVGQLCDLGLIVLFSPSGCIMSELPQTDQDFATMIHTQLSLPIKDPQSKRLRVSCHVIFGEHKMFSSMSSFHLSAPSFPSFFTDPFIDLFPADVLDAADACSLSYPSTIPTEMSAPPEDLATLSSSPQLLVIPIPPPSPTVHSSDIPLHRSARVKATPTHLRDYLCFAVILSHHEPHSYREASSNPTW